MQRMLLCVINISAKVLLHILGFSFCTERHGLPLFCQMLLIVSISPTFYEQLLRKNPFAKKLQTQILST
jgi:hypothetical protein